MSRLIVFVLYDAVNVLDVAGPVEVFSQPCRNRPAGSAEPYRIVLVSEHGGAVRTSAGVQMQTEPLAMLAGAAIDTLIVPGGIEAYPALLPIAAMAAQLAPQARRIASVCTGAVILAHAGLLAGRRATTHWRYVQQLRDADASVQIEANALYVQDGPLWTSAGISAGIDLALGLIEADLGHNAVMAVARQMVVFIKRPGGQSQFSAPLAAQSADAQFADLHAWMAAHLNQDLRVEVLAEQAHMSPRSFARHYTARTGNTPARAVELMRLEAASQLVLESDLPLKRIAAQCGFGDEQTLRRVFQRQLDATPQEYRERFGARSPA
ncbi:Transcriptional regulator GlxA family, contains an amidase domain and an AraC-type DNA-binding HTH domain [Andreprevotia lacus DSM 23236]|jgi:transcriptional regulator GlxA family with amidase domain|uniref:Transcriptional regulator GlxA family, contains an amidase domain and an AraC-type DNA-binding HTH domain n=1 Tax=Andreprevotia lacus DSM 23236 TaxID=1121001 RepID=A0A1W1XAY1_9NEIS|nr:DJ-1/PfpI family protein [Andreprevotia lacus]SMC21017.1 Transcriptional regulator GlxA family, contains an amidase domain and an AraC-type DNA-binding HTH domain [Andreprevotia lacus DSM 23236]